jgi:hypothetical protein
VWLLLWSTTERKEFLFLFTQDTGARIAQWYSTGLQAGWSVVWVLAGPGNFSLDHCIQTSSRANPISYSMGTRGSFPGVKWPGHEADHSPPSSAKVKNVWSYTSTSPIRLHGVVLSWRKHRDNFTLTFYTLPCSHRKYTFQTTFERQHSVSWPQWNSTERPASWVYTRWAFFFLFVHL